MDRDQPDMQKMSNNRAAGHCASALPDATQDAKRLGDEQGEMYRGLHHRLEKLREEVKHTERALSFLGQGAPCGMDIATGIQSLRFLGYRL